jgi:hypothetical protein
MELTLSNVLFGLVLVAIGWWVSTTRVHAWFIYGGTPTWRSGPRGKLEVLALRCLPGGHRVGFGLNVHDETTGFTLSPEEADRLASLLEDAAERIKARYEQAR